MQSVGFVCKRANDWHWNFDSGDSDDDCSLPLPQHEVINKLTESTRVLVLVGDSVRDGPINILPINK